MEQINQGLVISPDEAAALRRAFDDAWDAMRFAFPEREDFAARRMRWVLARVLVQAWRDGRRDRCDLVATALGALPPLPACWSRDVASRH